MAVVDDQAEPVADVPLEVEAIVVGDALLQMLAELVVRLEAEGGGAPSRLRRAGAGGKALIGAPAARA